MPESQEILICYRRCTHFGEYTVAIPEHFESADVEKWMKEKNNLKTELGYELFDRLITNNQDFMEVVCLSGKQE